jgi:hypothetical protein
MFLQAWPWRDFSKFAMMLRVCANDLRIEKFLLHRGALRMCLQPTVVGV